QMLDGIGDVLHFNESLRLGVLNAGLGQLSLFLQGLGLGLDSLDLRFQFFLLSLFQILRRHRCTEHHEHEDSPDSHESSLYWLADLLQEAAVRYPQNCTTPRNTIRRGGSRPKKQSVAG